MFRDLRAREPAWNDLSPGLPNWRPAAAKDAWLHTVTKLEGRLLSFESKSGEATDLFRLECVDGQVVFLKKAGPERRSLVEKAECLARWLHTKGLSVATSMPGYPMELQGGSLLIAMPYIEGRRVAPVAEDMVMLGATLAQLHDTLATHPDLPIWYETTKARLIALQQTRLMLASGDLAIGPAPNRLASLAAEEDLDFVDIGSCWKPLHGDLNPGNVLIANKSVVLLDFEDTQHSLHPPLDELCFVFERFVLTQTENEADAIHLGRIFVDAYGRERTTASKLSSTNILRSRALRSLCLLAGAEKLGSYVSENEWLKFFKLAEMARDRRSILEAVFGS